MTTVAFGRDLAELGRANRPKLGHRNRAFETEHAPRLSKDLDFDYYSRRLPVDGSGELREVIVDDVTDEIRFDAEPLVQESISQPSNLLPWDLVHEGDRLVRRFLHSLLDDGEVRRIASQGHGIGQGSLGDPVPQQLRGDDIHIHAQDSTELLAQAGQPHQRIVARRVEMHEDVDVATGGGVTAGDGSKEPRIAGSVAPQNLVQLLTAGSDGCPGVVRGIGNGHPRTIGAKAADHHQREAGTRRSWGRRGWHPRISEPAVGALRALRSPDRRMAFDHAVAARKTECASDPRSAGLSPTRSSGP